MRERESSIFSIFKTRREELEQKRQIITAQRRLSVGKVAGADPRTFSTKEPEFSVSDRVSCDIQTRGTTSNEVGAGDWIIMGNVSNS